MKATSLSCLYSSSLTKLNKLTINQNALKGMCTYILVYDGDVTVMGVQHHPMPIDGLQV